MQQQCACSSSEHSSGNHARAPRPPWRRGVATPQYIYNTHHYVQSSPPQDRLLLNNDPTHPHTLPYPSHRSLSPSPHPLPPPSVQSTLAPLKQPPRLPSTTPSTTPLIHVCAGLPTPPKRLTGQRPLFPPALLPPASSSAWASSRQSRVRHRPNRPRHARLRSQSNPQGVAPSECEIRMV